MSLPDTIPAVHEPSARSDAAYAPVVDISLNANGATLPRERRPMPGELVSLWDMLRLDAADFILLMKQLDRIATRLGEFEQVFAKDAALHGLNLEAQRGYCDGMWEIIGPLLNDVAQACRRMELTDCVSFVERVRANCDGKTYSFTDLQGALKALGEIIEIQLKDRLLLCAASDRTKYWSDTPLFSKKAQRRFRKAVDDMVEAGKCLAVGRFKACVSHLMLVVEIGVRHLAKKLGHTPGHKDSWGTILNHLNPVIAIMPTTTAADAERKSSFSKAADHLNHIRDAWRNKTMHPGLGYSEEQAILMFKNVQALMDVLANLR
jgi:hypothetical protein